jgi:hypothetical protein
MTKSDKEAMQRAIDLCRADPVRAEQIERKLLDHGFEEAGQFAAYCRQMTVLKLKPWEYPPCWGDENTHNSDAFPRAERLMKRLQRNGLSIWEPDPHAALRAVRKAKEADAENGRAE